MEKSEKQFPPSREELNSPSIGSFPWPNLPLSKSILREDTVSPRTLKARNGKYNSLGVEWGSSRKKTPDSHLNGHPGTDVKKPSFFSSHKDDSYYWQRESKYSL